MIVKGAGVSKNLDIFTFLIKTRFCTFNLKCLNYLRMEKL